jgi:hypothetical protein
MVANVADLLGGIAAPPSSWIRLWGKPQIMCDRTIAVPWRLMTHKYKGSIVVLLISKSVQSNEEQKKLIGGFPQGFLCKCCKIVWVGSVIAI